MTLSECFKRLTRPLRLRVVGFVAQHVRRVVPQKAGIDSGPGGFGVAGKNQRQRQEFLAFLRSHVSNLVQRAIGVECHAEGDFLSAESEGGDIDVGVVFEPPVIVVEGLQDHVECPPVAAGLSGGTSITPSSMVARKKCGIALSFSPSWPLSVSKLFPVAGANSMSCRM